MDQYALKHALPSNILIQSMHNVKMNALQICLLMNSIKHVSYPAQSIIMDLFASKPVILKHIYKVMSVKIVILGVNNAQEVQTSNAQVALSDIFFTRQINVY